MKVNVTTINCPNCGAECSKNYGDKDAHIYGSPLRTCPKCGATYIDKRFHEIALEGAVYDDIDPYQKKNKKESLTMMLFGAALTVGTLLLSATGRIYPIAFAIGCFSLVIGLVSLIRTGKRSVKNKRAELEEELKRSSLRLQNPQYLDALRLAGYDIPPDFTPKDTLD